MIRFLKFFYLTTLLTLPIGQLSRLTIFPNVVVYLNDLLLPVLALLYFVYAFGIRKKFYPPPFSLRILIFILIAALSLLLGSLKLSSSEAVVSSLFLLRFIEYVLLYFIGFDLFQDQKFARLLTKTFIFVGFLVALVGFAQVLVIPDFSQLASEGGWDPHQYRLLSTFFDPNFVGGFFVIVISYVLTWFFFKPRIKEKVALVLFGGSLILAIILTLSRSTYLAFFVSLLTFASFKSKRVFLSVLVVSLLVFLSVPAVRDRVGQAFSLDDAASARLVSWKNALQVASDHPLIGVGFNTYRYVQEDYGFITSSEDSAHSASGVDSSLLLVLATTGVVGLISYLSIFVGLGVKAFQKRKNSLSLAFLVTLTAMLVHSQFVNSLFYPQIMEVLWIGAALMVTEKDD